MASNAGQGTVLIVDDEKAFLLSLVDGLSLHSAQFRVKTASNGREAVDLLRTCDVDVVVTDLKMPEMDGFDLLAHMSNAHPTVPVIVMTAFGTAEVERRVKELGLLRYLEKPINLGELAKAILELLAAGPRSVIQGIALSAFLQLVEMERKTCTLTVRSGDRTGWLYFSSGAIIDAESGSARSTEAAQEIICWEECQISVDNSPVARPRTIERSLHEILIEAMRIFDERKREEEMELRAAQERGEAQGSEEMAQPIRESTDILDDLLKIPDVSAAVVVGRDGFIIESSGGSNLSADSLGASLAHAINGLEEMGAELEVDGFEDLFVAFGKAVILCRPAGDAVVAVVAPDASKLGIIRHKAKKLIEELADFF